MKIQTFSVVVGGKKCNASCPYCVSKMTGDDGLCDAEEINKRNFHKACQFAQMSGVSTVLLTGKGEPLLYLDLITEYLEIIKQYHFPFVELQTNGIQLPFLSTAILKKWYNLGLTTVSLSCVHWISKKNREIFGNKYGVGPEEYGYNLSTYIELLHDIGFSVRVSCVMVKGYIDDIYMVKEFLDRCKSWKVEQFTIRPVTCVEGENNKITRWVKEHMMDGNERVKIEKYFENNAHLLLNLVHGAKVYDYKGQNISINTCLTESPNPDDIRQLIFFPDGSIKYSWVYPGAIII